MPLLQWLSRDLNSGIHRVLGALLHSTMASPLLEFPGSCLCQGVMSRPTEPAAGGTEACLGNCLSHVDIPSEMTLVETTMAVITALQSFPWHMKPAL